MSSRLRFLNLDSGERGDDGGERLWKPERVAFVEVEDEETSPVGEGVLSVRSLEDLRRGS